MSQSKMNDSLMIMSDLLQIKLRLLHAATENMPEAMRLRCAAAEAGLLSVLHDITERDRSMKETKKTDTDRIKKVKID